MTSDAKDVIVIGAGIAGCLTYEGLSQTSLSKDLDVSRARVTHVLPLLDLAPAVVASVEATRIPGTCGLRRPFQGC